MGFTEERCECVNELAIISRSGALGQQLRARAQRLISRDVTVIIITVILSPGDVFCASIRRARLGRPIRNSIFHNPQVFTQSRFRLLFSRSAFHSIFPRKARPASKVTCKALA